MQREKGAARIGKRQLSPIDSITGGSDVNGCSVCSGSRGDGPIRRADFDEVVPLACIAQKTAVCRNLKHRVPTDIGGSLCQIPLCHKGAVDIPGFAGSASTVVRPRVASGNQQSKYQRYAKYSDKKTFLCHFKLLWFWQTVKNTYKIVLFITAAGMRRTNRSGFYATDKRS
ncbi:MAG: hypothetical protein LBU03_01430 [Tannerellaceae bacterium]|nr:hypothetical protein [Tannerellaceae bacterium]